MPDKDTYSNLSLLIKACYWNTAVASASRRLSAECLRMYGATYVQAHLYGVFESYWQKYDRLPMMDWFISQAHSFHERLSTPEYDQHRQELEALASAIVNGFTSEVNVKFFGDLISHIYKTTIGNMAIQNAASEAVNTGQYNVLAEQVGQVLINATSARESYSLFKKSKAKKLDVIPTGVPFMDRMLGGGLHRSNSYGILAPTGGGKTTLAGQIAVLAGLQGAKVALILTEQSVDEPELIDRFWALITGQKSDVFAPCDTEDDFPPHLMTEEVLRAKDVVDANVRAYDFARIQGDLDEIRGIAGGIDGFKPDIVILDWAGKLATQMVEQGHNCADNEVNALKYIASGMNNIANTQNVAAIVFHQLRSDCDRPMTRYTHVDANGCKQFCHTLSYGIVLHPRDDNDILLVATTKGRWIGRSEQLVELRGAYAKFVEVNGYMKGNKRWEKESDVSKMPDDPAANKSPIAKTYYNTVQE